MSGFHQLTNDQTESKRLIIQESSWDNYSLCLALYIPWTSSWQVVVVTHCNKNPIYVLLFRELRGLSPSFHIHVYVSDLYNPRIGLHISCSRIYRSIVDSQTHECGNWDCGRAIPFREYLFQIFGISSLKCSTAHQRKKHRIVYCYTVPVRLPTSLFISKETPQQDGDMRKRDIVQD